MDLEKFFDRVNHNILMSKLVRKVSDGWVLKLICRYLKASMMADGVVSPPIEVPHFYRLKFTHPLETVKILPSASFRLHLAVDTLAVRLIVPHAGPIADLHRQVIRPPPREPGNSASQGAMRHAWRTTKKRGAEAPR